MNSPGNLPFVFAIIVLSVAVVNTLPQRPSAPGSDPCSRGPSYWCSSYESMNRCGNQAYNYCRGTPAPYIPDYYDPYNECRFGYRYICSSNRLVKLCDIDYWQCAVYYGISSLAGSGSSGIGSSGPGSPQPGSSPPGSSGLGSSRPGSSRPGSSRP